MGIEWLTLLLIAGLLLLLVIGVPLAFATGFLAVVLALVQFGPASLLLIPARIIEMMNQYVLLAVPLFILMGVLMEKSGVAHALFRVMHIWSGPLRGGLAVGTVLAGTVLAAMVGIVGAEVVTLGLVALPAMLERGYDRRMALGTICAAGSLGTMMPPSIVLIVYGLVANVAIGQLFLAAIVPALMLAAGYIAYILLLGWRRPHLAPPAPDEERAMPLVDKILLVRDLVLPMLIIVGVMGSLYAGIATPTEAAAIGVAGALLAAAINGRLTFASVREATVTTGFTIGTVIFVFFGANALISVYNLAGGLRYIDGLITGTDLPALGVVALMLVILLILGTIVDWIGITLLTMPVFVPVVQKLGLDPIWFGILFCIAMQVSYLTPPFGPAAFYLKSVAPPDISLGDIFASVWPFVIVQVLVLILVLLFPQLALWLPALVQPPV